MNKIAKTPEHQNVYELLRDRILLGKFVPGQPLTIMGLAGDLSVGMTPVREALRRLAAEKAVTMLANRRIVVPERSIEDIEDIYFLRFTVESELAARAAKCISSKQLDALVKIDASIDLTLEQGDVEAYLEGNNQFHFMIYESANAPLLFHVAQSLWIQIGPSLRIVFGRFGTANLPDKHSEVLSALGAADSAAAALAMRGDLQQSLSLVRSPALEKYDQKKVASLC